MRPSLLRSKFWFFLIISLVLILAPKSVIADNILSCSARSRCGNIQNIGYPFWGLDRPESCGYPGFKLNCNEDILEITIMSATYQVRAINSTSRIIELARIDYTNNICPTRLINSTFDPSLFQYSSDMQDIRLYYGCLQPLPSEEENLTSIQGNFRQFDCRINETNITGYYVTRNITESSFGDLFTFVSRFLGFCNSSVIIPVPVIEVQSWDENPDPDALEEAFRVGFDLRWSANDNLCNACINSGGQCGHSFLSTEFTCYCSNGSYSDVCPRRSSGKLAKSVIFGLGFGIPGAVIVGILLGMGILRVRQQRRKKIAAQLNSRDLPTPPSSKGPTTSTTNRSQSNPSFSTSNYDVERGSTYFGAHLFSYEELEQATDNFNPSKELGEGGFGTVYYGVLNDGRVVAVKRLYENNFKRVDQYMNEIDILTRIRHPNLVTLYGCTSRRSRELLLVYEYIPNGTVADHLHGNRSNYCSLTWPVRLNITVETAKALAYLHSEDIIHRDVKSNNILLDKNFHVKVADFGLSRLFPTDVTHISTAPQGTPGYVDPEYHQCYQLTEKSDVYSFGVVLIELISAKQAVDINRHRHDINLANMAVSRIQNQALHELVDPTLGFENNYSVKKAITIVAELAFRCLQQQRDMRPSMAEVLETLTEIQDEQLRVQRAEVVDIRSDDVGLLRHIPPPLSPDSATEKWLQIRSDDVGLLKNVPPPLSKDSATDKWVFLSFLYLSKSARLQRNGDSSQIQAFGDGVYRRRKPRSQSHQKPRRPLAPSQNPPHATEPLFCHRTSPFSPTPRRQFRSSSTSSSSSSSAKHLQRRRHQKLQQEKKQAKIEGTIRSIAAV